MHRERAHAVLADLRALSERHVSFDPFLEIGAGSVQRSAALVNNYPAAGIATDISSLSLQDAPYMRTLLNYTRLPMLISCDAHHLPFLENSFRFVFAYQALHHFSNPIPVIAECYRVLAKDGHFFFNEEPMDSSLRRFLRGERVLSHPPTPLQRIGYSLGVEKLFWDDGAVERSLGMTEARFDLDLWRKALEPFEILDFEVNRKLRIRSNLRTPSLNAMLSGIVGGNAKGVCIKREGETAGANLQDRLMCLDCRSSELFQAESLCCRSCGREYPVEKGVIRMLPKSLESELYPAAGSAE